MRKRAQLALVELMLLTAGVGCKSRSNEPPRIAASATPLQRPTLAPRVASPFVCRDGNCRQEHPRLPDTGEWRCAERDHVVWCAGGEPAAGVVSGPPDPKFRCGPRWGQTQERVCVDQHPDYPNGAAGDYACRFEQERGVARICSRSESAPLRPLRDERALAACWLDRDCPSGACDRGSCACHADSECQAGRCQNGACVEAKP